jgi:hypothetical protein
VIIVAAAKAFTELYEIGHVLIEKLRFLCYKTVKQIKRIDEQTAEQKIQTEQLEKAVRSVVKKLSLITVRISLSVRSVVASSQIQQPATDIFASKKLDYAENFKDEELKNKEIKMNKEDEDNAIFNS